jgi:hypothetical protein
MNFRPGNLFYTAILLFLLIGIKSCTPSIVATSYFDRSVDYQKYHTFAWIEPEATASATPTTQIEPLLDRRVRDAVASELVKRGIMPDAEDPDLLIAYDVAIAQDPNVTTDPNSPGIGYSYLYGYRYNYNTAGFPDYRPITSYQPGTLTIDMVDPDTNQLVWRGVAEGGIDAAQTEEKRIRRSIAGILTQYPHNQPPH